MLDGICNPVRNVLRLKRYGRGCKKGKQIYTYIICTHFPTPSSLPVPAELKLTDLEKVAGKMLSMGSFSDEQINQATGVSLEKIRYLREIKNL